jgi:hypothetical protein
MKNILMILRPVATLVAAGAWHLRKPNEHRNSAAAAPEQKYRRVPDRQNLNAPQKSGREATAAPEQKAPEGKTGRQNLSAPQKSGSVTPAPIAQAPEGKTDRKLNTPQKVESEKPTPSAQLPQKQTGAEAVGQGRGSQPSQHNAQTQSERTAPNAAAQAPAALSTEHHAQIRETIRSEKVAPLTDVHFSVTIGEAVPRTVHLNRLPPRILKYAPQYRGYEYILVGDDILIVDPRTLRIVAVIAA